VKARCTDLVEIIEGAKVDFLHRTVYDFLVTEDIHVLLVQWAGASFRPHLYMCKEILSQLKHLPESGRDIEPNDQLQALIECFLSHARQIDYQSGSTEIRVVDDLAPTLKIF